MILTIEGEPKEIAELLKETKTRPEILNQSSGEIAALVQSIFERTLTTKPSARVPYT